MSAKTRPPADCRGHLWRIDPRTYQWQHVAAIGEDLIATASAGRYVFALGATNHVLYRYDTASSTTKRVVVGSIAGHVSRNLFADARGHVYVPRAFARGDGKAFADLVEYDDNLVAVAATPLDYYFGNEALSPTTASWRWPTLPTDELSLPRIAASSIRSVPGRASRPA